MSVHAQSEEMRKKLMECAAESFAKKGYAATRLADVGSAAGVSRGPLYYYFSNKIELYRATVQYQIEKAEKAYAEIFAMDAPVSEIIRRDFDFCLTNDAFFIIRMEGAPDITDYWSAFSRWLIEQKQAAFTRALERGELRADCDVSRLITFIYVYYSGIVSVRERSKAQAGFSESMLANPTEQFMAIIKSEFLA